MSVRKSVRRVMSGRALAVGALTGAAVLALGACGPVRTTTTSGAPAPVQSRTAADPAASSPAAGVRTAAPTGRPSARATGAKSTPGGATPAMTPCPGPKLDEGVEVVAVVNATTAGIGFNRTDFECEAGQSPADGLYEPNDKLESYKVASGAKLYLITDRTSDPYTTTQVPAGVVFKHIADCAADQPRTAAPYSCDSDNFYFLHLNPAGKIDYLEELY